MATYGSDDEQVEALKNWWSENGTSLLTGVIIVLAIFFGARQWQASRTAESGAASELYQQIADMALANLTTIVAEDDLLAAQALYNQLRTEHENSIYTRYAALAMARFQVEHDALDMAATELQWLLDNPGRSFLQKVDEELLLTARLRLARIKLAQGEAEAALVLLRDVEPGSFAGSFAEAEGDALRSMGQRDAARTAYQRALAANTSGNPALLQLKLQDLGVSPVEQL